MRNYRGHRSEQTVATTRSDGIFANNLRSHLCGVQINQFIAATKTYDANAT